MARETWNGTSIARDVVKTQIPANEDELYAIKTEVENARDGEANLLAQIDDIQADISTVTTEVQNARDGAANLLAQIDALQADIAVLAQSNGSMVSSNDTNLAYLEDKIVDGNGTDVQVNNDGGSETIQVNLVPGTQNYNLLSNSQFLANSRCTIGDTGVGTYSVSDITNGVCTCSGLWEDRAVGRLIYFGAGGSTANKYYQIIAINSETPSFTIHDTSITDATAVSAKIQDIKYVGADAYAPDGWIKDTTADLYVLGDYSGDAVGSGRQLKLTPSAANDFVGFPSDGNAIAWVDKFKGATVVMGAWVKTSTASHARLRIGSTGSLTSSSYHTGGGDWEWLEVSASFATDASDALFRLYVDNSSGDCYMTCPILMYGSYIGSGNYAPKPNDFVRLDTAVDLPTISTTGQSDVAATELNLLAETQGKIDGAESFILRSMCNDSGSYSAANDVYLRVGSDVSNSLIQHDNDLWGIAGDKYQSIVSEVLTDDSGHITYQIEASAATNFDVQACDIQAVRFR